MIERAGFQILRTWDASQGSLRNFTGKTLKKGNCPQCSFASFGVSFRALSGASCDASEEAFVFRLADVWHRAQAPRKTDDLLIQRKGKMMKIKTKIRLGVGAALVGIPVAFLIIVLRDWHFAVMRENPILFLSLCAPYAVMLGALFAPSKWIYKVLFWGCFFVFMFEGSKFINEARSKFFGNVAKSGMTKSHIGVPKGYPYTD